MVNYNRMTDTQKQVKAFESLVMRILSDYDMYYVLTRCETKTRVLSETAQFFFFNILLDLLIRDFFLESAKILENRITFGKKNLSIQHFLNMNCWTEKQTARLKEYFQQLSIFYDCIKCARDKIISHNDLSTYNEETLVNLGGFEEGLDAKFVESLEEFYNYLHEITFGEIWGRFNPSMEVGGIHDLISFLYQGLAFEAIVNDIKTSSKVKTLLVEKNLEIRKF